VCGVCVCVLCVCVCVWGVCVCVWGVCVCVCVWCGVCCMRATGTGGRRLVTKVSRHKRIMQLANLPPAPQGRS